MKAKIIVKSEAKEDFSIYLYCAPYSDAILEEDEESFASFIQELASKKEMPSPTISKKKNKGKKKKKKKEGRGKSSLR